MPKITKNVDKTIVNDDEIFIYTINAEYSGLSGQAKEGKIIDIIPSKIKYTLPRIGGQIKSITETEIENATQLTFNLGSVNSGTSLSFEVGCHFDAGRVENDSYTNHVQLIADDVVVADTNAPTVNLNLDENFRLSKLTRTSSTINAGDEVTFIINLTNSKSAGASIKNVVVTDTLPPELIPITSFTPIGKDVPVNGYFDDSANGFTGRWEDNTLIFDLPKYSGWRYEIMFKAKVAENVTPAQQIQNIGKWTADGEIRNEDSVTLSVYDPNATGFNLSKYGNRTTIVGAPIDYEMRNSNAGNSPLNNYELEDIIPAEVDITGFSLIAFEGLLNYSVYVALESSPNDYIPVVENVKNGEYPYTDLSELIPLGDRLAKIKLTAEQLAVENSYHILYIYGTTNSKASMINYFTNKAYARSGSISQSSSCSTRVDDQSDLRAIKTISPRKPNYYPLDELDFILTGCPINTFCINPILVDLMPKGLKFVKGSEYFVYYESATKKSYDSREPNFPVKIPTAEVIENFAGSEDTLYRWNFEDFILPRYSYIDICFKAVVEIDAPSSFVNKGYVGVNGNNVFMAYDEVIDTLDVDGDGLYNDKISCDEVKCLVLKTSEFSLKKFVKGQLDSDYTDSGVTVQGGDIDYRLQITNNQPVNLKNIEVVDILPFVGDTGVILVNQERGSQFNVYLKSLVTAKIINVLGEDGEKNPDIIIEYSTSKNPKRFDEFGTGDWSVNAPSDIKTISAIKVKTGADVILHPYDRLVIDFVAQAPIGTPKNKIAYNSYAVRADKISGSAFEPLLPTEPTKVQVTINENEKGSIGGFVWIDSNKNSIYDESEIGINDVKVELYDDNNNLLKTTFTTTDFNNNLGYYLFDDLEDGIYKVKFIPLPDYALTKKSSQANGSKADSSTGFTDDINVLNSEQIFNVNAGLVLDVSPCNQAVTDIFESVALEQTAISYILNAENKKIEKATDLNSSIEDLLKVNDSVKDMVNALTRLEMVLQSKLDLF